MHNKQTPIRQAEAVGLHHSTRWWSDYFCFIFVRYSVQISDVRPAMVRGNSLPSAFTKFQQTASNLFFLHLHPVLHYTRIDAM